MISSRRRHYPLSCALALLGLAFSVWNILGSSSALCLTDGCSLFADFNISGVSLWWLGALGFAVLLVPALFGWGHAGMFIAGAGMLFDCLLLAVMLFTAPCFSCLLIGLLMALTYAAFRQDALGRQKPRYSVPLIIWTCFFIVNVSVIFSEMRESWAIMPPKGGQVSAADAGVQIYFSPSCAACRQLIQTQGQTDGVAWYPVPENSDDIWRIRIMREKLAAGDSLTLALAAATASDALDSVRVSDMLSPEVALLQFRLWRNAAHVLHSGTSRLPFVEYRGIPSPLTPAREKVPSAGGADFSLPGLSAGGFCDGSSPEPCAP